MAGIDAILRAVYRKDSSLLARLRPGEVNLTDADGRSPLMHAVLAGEPELVRQLLALGADPNAADGGRQWTALHFAADGEQAASARALLDAGATVDPVDTFGNTPLWRAVMSSKADLQAIRILLEHGADPGKKNASGNSPIDVASAAGLTDIARLLAAGSDDSRRGSTR